MTDFPSPSSRPATITNVAHGAGTDKTSASRYLNSETQVLSEGLRQCIEAAIQRLDYRPNQMARGLKHDRNRLPGMLVVDPTNPYTVEILQGVEAACRALGYIPLICHTTNEVEMKRRFVQLLTTYRVEGPTVNAFGAEEAVLRPLRGDGILTMLVDRTVGGFGADLVGLDNRGAVSLGMQHLLDQGFDAIQFIVQLSQQVSSWHERERVFREAVATRGRPVERVVVLDPDNAASIECALAEITTRIDAVHSRGGKRLALFVTNAPVMLIMARHLRTQFGAAWQEHTTLSSIDDPEWTGLVGITAIRRPTYDIGYRTVEFVHERIGGVTGGARVVLLLSTPVERVSTMHVIKAVS